MIGQFTKIVLLATALFAAASTPSVADAAITVTDDNVNHDVDAALMKILAAGNAKSVNKCLNRKQVHLTYDDGPGRLTNNLLDDLAAARVPASFYINAVNFKAHGAFTKRAYAEGHVIASHTWSHIQLTKADKQTITEQMMRNHNAVYQMTGKHMAMMRPPYGAHNDRVDQVLGSLGYKTVVLWNIDTNDWRAENKRQDAAADYVRGQARGATKPMIVLQHDIHEWSALSAPNMIKHLRNAGYTLVDLKTCLGKEPYHPASYVPAHAYEHQTFERCTLGSPNGNAMITGKCMDAKNCDHFEAGARFSGKCKGHGDRQCCAGGCHSMCESRFGEDGARQAACKNACYAAKADQSRCDSRGGDPARCPCSRDQTNSSVERACRVGFAFGFASSDTRQLWGCQRFCADSAHWLTDEIGCIAACSVTKNGDNRGDCSACQSTACDGGCAFGSVMYNREAWKSENKKN